MTDIRIVYGSRCSYWGDIQRVSTLPSGLPVCPWCHGTLFQADREDLFLDAAATHEADGHPGYLAFIEWLKHRRCVPKIADALSIFERRQRRLGVLGAIIECTVGNGTVGNGIGFDVLDLVAELLIARRRAEVA